MNNKKKEMEDHNQHGYRVFILINCRKEISFPKFVFSHQQPIKEFHQQIESDTKRINN